MKQTLQLMASTYERDKVLKIAQYLYRFLWWRAGNAGRKAEAARLLRVSGSVSLGRKMYRLGYSLEEFSKLLSLARLGHLASSPEQALASSRALASLVFWLLDNLYWARKVELLPGDTATLNRWRIGFWLASVVLAAPPAARAWLASRGAARRDEKTHANNTANAVRVGGDLVVASSFAVATGVLPPLFEVHEGLVGIAGVVSGVAGLYMSLNK